MANHRWLATLGAGFLTIAAGMAPTTASATPPAASSSEQSFQRVSTFSVYTNNENPEDETVAEIVAATSDGRTLVYTDGVNGTIGIIDIADPANPLPQGVIDVGGLYLSIYPCVCVGATCMESGV